MYCINCGNKINIGAKFCGSCGFSTNDKELEMGTNELLYGENNEEKQPIWTYLLSFVAIVGGFVLGKLLGLIFFLFLFAWIIGAWFPKWYLSRKKHNKNVIKWIIISNYFAWFIPVIGVAVGVATIEFGKLDPLKKDKYLKYAIVGICLSLINATIGYLIYK